MLQRFGQHRRQVDIALDGRDVLRVLQQGHGERADARADFKHVVRALELRQRTIFATIASLTRKFCPSEYLAESPWSARTCRVTERLANDDTLPTALPLLAAPPPCFEPPLPDLPARFALGACGFSCLACTVPFVPRLALACFF